MNQLQTRSAKLQIGFFTPEDGQSHQVAIQLGTGGNPLTCSPDLARTLAHGLHESADVCDRMNGVDPTTAAAPVMLVGEEVALSGARRVALMPGNVPTNFYLEPAQARDLALKLLARADSADQWNAALRPADEDAHAPALPEPCVLCGNTGRVTYNPGEDSFDAGGLDLCPLCTPEDPA